MCTITSISAAGLWRLPEFFGFCKKASGNPDQTIARMCGIDAEIFRRRLNCGASPVARSSLKSIAHFRDEPRSTR